jgi:hypothetical protein
MTDWKQVAKNIINRDRTYQPRQRPPLYPFARPETVVPSSDDQDDSHDIITWHLIHPGTGTLQ